MKKLLLLLVLFCVVYTQAQVKIGTDPTNINPNSLLELESTNKGLLLPRVALTNISSFAPLAAHIPGMVVYNTATSVTGVTGSAVGLYQNDGIQWVKLTPQAGGSALIGQTSGVISNPGAISGNETWLGDGAGSGGNSTDGTVIIGGNAGISSDGNNAQSIYIGTETGNNNIDSQVNTIVGTGSGITMTRVRNSNVIGNTSLQNSTDVIGLNLIGNDAGQNLTEVTDTNMFGTGAGSDSNRADFANFIGFRAGQASNHADNSIFIGTRAGINTPTAANSIFIGENAGSGDTVDNTGGRDSILIGRNTNTGGFSSSIAIGDGATNTTNSQFMIGAVTGGIQYDMVNPKYPQSRNDSGTTAPINFLYTDANGKFLSAPVAALGGSGLIGQTSGVISNPGAISGNETWLGDGAGVGSSTNQSTLIGALSGNGADNNADSTILGYASGMSSIAAEENVMIGSYAGEGSERISRSNIIGIGSASRTISGTLSSDWTNVNLLGRNSGNNAINVDSSNFIGSGVANNIENVRTSNFIGQNAGSNLSGGVNGNITNANIIGNEAGKDISDVSDINMIGYQAGQNTNSSSYTTIIGLKAGQNMTHADSSIMLGNYAGNNTSGASNVIFIGNNAGTSDTVSNTGGRHSILIGNNTNTGGFSNSIAIGDGARNTTSGQLMIGTPDTILYPGTQYDMVNPKYPQSRDDSGTTAPINFLYTDANGKFLSAPVTALGGSGWSLTGNAGSVAGTNFIGTTDNVDVVFKRDNIGAGVLNVSMASTSFGAHTPISYSNADNSAFGYKALYLGSNTKYNTAIGAYTLANCITGGDYNTVVGASAGLVISTGNRNTLIGSDAGRHIDTGSMNIAIGPIAGTNLISGDANIYIGRPAFSATDSRRLRIGSNGTDWITGDSGEISFPFYPNTRDDSGVTSPINFLYTNASGDILSAPVAALGGGWSLTGNAGTVAGTNFIGTTDNVDVVFKRNNIDAGVLNESSFSTTFGVGTRTNFPRPSNSAFGYNALNAASNSRANTAMGHNALASLIDSGSNTAVGANAGMSILGGGNTIIGASAGANIALADNNTVVGTGAGVVITTGNNNIALGAGAGTVLTTGSDNIYIGRPAVSVTESRTLRIGSSSVEWITGDNGKIAINTGSALPRAQLEVGGTDAIMVPVGTTAQRPATPLKGMIRFNDTTGSFEGYNGTTWVNF